MKAYEKLSKRYKDKFGIEPDNNFNDLKKFANGLCVLLDNSELKLTDLSLEKVVVENYLMQIKNSLE